MNAQDEEWIKQLVKLNYKEVGLYKSDKDLHYIDLQYQQLVEDQQTIEPLV